MALTLPEILIYFPELHITRAGANDQNKQSLGSVRLSLILGK